MSLYRLDFSYPDGRLVPVADPIFRSDYLTRDRAAARRTAKVAAAEYNATVVCTRIYGAGMTRESFRVSA